MKSLSKLLLIGDVAAPTGFSTVTDNLLHHLTGWEIVVSGINYSEAPHVHPHRILPAGPDLGIPAFAQLLAAEQPDVTLILSDWWNVHEFCLHAPRGIKIVGMMPVDGMNVHPPTAFALRQELHAAIVFTEFAKKELGFGEVIPHGVDLDIFRPVDRQMARRILGLPQNAFIVGNVNRNHERKRLDLTLEYFARWIKTRNDADHARLLFHHLPGDHCYDLHSLASFHGISERIICTGADFSSVQMPLIYGSINVQVSTTSGEGWSLTVMEGMACGIPQIVPDFAALGEWTEDAARKVPCSHTEVRARIGTVGRLPDESEFLKALDQVFENRHPAGLGWADRGTKLINRPDFRWGYIAARVDSVLRSAL
jgi:D-inositol-3-phosphate glycosyltransferase